MQAFTVIYYLDFTLIFSERLEVYGYQGSVFVRYARIVDTLGNIDDRTRAQLIFFSVTKKTTITVDTEGQS